MDIKYCTECGKQLNVKAEICPGCGVRQSPPANSSDAAMRMLLPVDRSGLAIIAGYAGLFSLLILPAPISLLFGILAVADIRKNPKKFGMGRALFGLITGALGTLFLLFMIAGKF